MVNWFVLTYLFRKAFCHSNLGVYGHLQYIVIWKLTFAFMFLYLITSRVINTRTFCLLIFFFYFSTTSPDGYGVVAEKWKNMYESTI